MKRLLAILTMTIVAFTFAIGNATAAPAEQPVKVIVMPDHADWNYKCGEKPIFTGEFFHKVTSILYLRACSA